MGILDILSELRSGQTLVEINRDYQDLVNAVRDHRRKGALILTLTFEPGKGDDSEELMIAHDVKIKKPSPASPSRRCSTSARPAGSPATIPTR